mgnify:FL=1
MAKLYPTLWRTCRMLSGATRLDLFRQVVASPGLTVSALAQHAGISLPRASQELRRLQSRGLLQAVRRGLHVQYRPVADRLVPTARPLLQAMQESFQRQPDNAAIVPIAVAFSHERRLALVQLLLRGPWNVAELGQAVGMSRNTLNRHLRCLRAAQLIRKTGKMIVLAEADHPLARCLTGLLDSRPAAPTAPR